MPHDAMWNSIARNPQFYNNATEGLQMDTFVYYNFCSFFPGEYLLNTVPFLTAVWLPWRGKVSDSLCYRAATLVLAAPCDCKLIRQKEQYETSVSLCVATYIS
jgi:hypothetical protein